LAIWTCAQARCRGGSDAQCVGTTQRAGRACAGERATRLRAHARRGRAARAGSTATGSMGAYAMPWLVRRWARGSPRGLTPELTSYDSFRGWPSATLMYRYSGGTCAPGGALSGPGRPAAPLRASRVCPAPAGSRPRPPRPWPWLWASLAATTGSRSEGRDLASFLVAPDKMMVCLCCSDVRQVCGPGALRASLRRRPAAAAAAKRLPPHGGSVLLHDSPCSLCWRAGCGLNQMWAGAQAPSPTNRSARPLPCCRAQVYSHTIACCDWLRLGKLFRCCWRSMPRSNAQVSFPQSGVVWLKRQGGQGAGGGGGGGGGQRAEEASGVFSAPISQALVSAGRPAGAIGGEGSVQAKPGLRADKVSHLSTRNVSHEGR
jgi:hypothetical protein